MNFEAKLQQEAVRAIAAIYEQDIDPNQIQIQETRREFEGDFTLVVFPLLRMSRKGPEQTAQELGEWLQANASGIRAFNVIKGFLNLSLDDNHWFSLFGAALTTENYGYGESTGKTVMLEYSSPNTNKPLHLGHVRNNLLGFSVAKILEASGHKLIKANLINDRGIHICKSMLAWQKFGEGETPESSGIKGDHLVGKYYVLFDAKLRGQAQAAFQPIWEAYQANSTQEELLKHNLSEKEAKELHESASKYLPNGTRIVEDKKGDKKEMRVENDGKVLDVFRPKMPLMEEAREMLRSWEAKDQEVFSLWETMNNWVYDGFQQTYDRLGVNFDKFYYESNTYLLGKELVQIGLEKGVLYQKEDGSVWADLSDSKISDKLLLRSDGTSVYMTQDLGTAIERFREFADLKQLIYTVGDEQNHHFKVLFLILKKLGYDWAKDCHHLSYGMVDLPAGKMKSREGTVVDADELMTEVTEAAEKEAVQHERFREIPEADQTELFRMLGMGALKFYILKVDPKRRMLFNPEESVSLHGDTGPFIQYGYARTQALARRAGELPAWNTETGHEMQLTERELLKVLSKYPATIQEAAANYDPSLISTFALDVVKAYNRFYHEERIFHETVSEDSFAFRIHLSGLTGEVIRSAMDLLGIEVPKQM